MSRIHAARTLIAALIQIVDRQLAFARPITAEILISHVVPSALSIPIVHVIALALIIDASILAPVFAGSKQTVASSITCPFVVVHKATQGILTAHVARFPLLVRIRDRVSLEKCFQSPCVLTIEMDRFLSKCCDLLAFSTLTKAN